MPPFYEKTTVGVAPISLADAKAWLKQDATADDDLIDDLIDGVTLAAENHIGRQLRATTWTSLWDGFPPWFCLSQADIASITSVKYTLEDTQETVDSADYNLSRGVAQSTIFPADGFTWPNTDPIPQAVEVIFVSGFTSLPADIKTALLEDIAFAYVNRGDTQAVGGSGTVQGGGSALQPQTMALLNRYRIRRV